MRKLSPQDEKALATLWLDPENNRTKLAERFGLSRFGARLIVERYLNENAPAALSSDTGQGLTASTKPSGSAAPIVADESQGPDQNKED